MCPSPGRRWAHSPTRLRRTCHVSYSHTLASLHVEKTLALGGRAPTEFYGVLKAGMRPALLRCSTEDKRVAAPTFATGLDGIGARGSREGACLVVGVVAPVFAQACRLCQTEHVVVHDRGRFERPIALRIGQGAGSWLTRVRLLSALGLVVSPHRLGRWRRWRSRRRGTPEPSGRWRTRSRRWWGTHVVCGWGNEAWG